MRSRWEDRGLAKGRECKENQGKERMKPRLQLYERVRGLGEDEAGGAGRRWITKGFCRLLNQVFVFHTENHMQSRKSFKQASVMIQFTFLNGHLLKGGSSRPMENG